MNSKPSFSEYIRQIQVICIALIIGQLLFLGISIYLVKYSGTNFGNGGLNEIFIYIVPLFSISSMLGSYIFFKSKLIKVKDTPNLFTKLGEYRSAQIVRWALLEGPSFFSIIAYLLTGNYLYLGLVTLIIVLFILTIPNRGSVENELELSWEEKNQLGE